MAWARSEEFDVDVTSNMSGAGSGDVMLIGGTDGRGFGKSWVDGRINARVKGSNSSKIWLMYDRDDIVVPCFQPLRLLIGSLNNSKSQEKISSRQYFTSARGRKSPTDWVGVCTDSYFSSSQIGEDSKAK